MDLKMEYLGMDTMTYNYLLRAGARSILDVCDILNDIEGSDKYSIEIKSTDNTDKSNTDKSNSNQNTKSNGNNQKSTNKNNNNNKNTNKNNEEEYQSGDYGDYTKCPNCKKRNALS